MRPLDWKDWTFLAVLIFGAIIAGGAGLEAGYAARDAHAIEVRR